jgi:hypothetical protein
MNALLRRTSTLTAVFALLSLLGFGLSSDRHERILYAALPTGLALIALGATSWLYGSEIARRPQFEWYGFRYFGPRIKPFSRGFQAGGIALAALGLWCLSLWAVALAGR